MKKLIIRWSLRFTALAILLFGLLIIIVLTPSILYANKTSIESFTVYHDQALDKDLKLRLDDATEIIKSSELYDPEIKFDICMNDGSLYSSLLQIFLGKAFALGFTSNKVAFCGDVNVKENYVEVNGYKWNLTQLIAHEEMHCMVFHKIGFWDSNPVADYPVWKWEGYPEYISRRTTNQATLSENIKHLNEEIKKDKDAWSIMLSDNTISPRDYYYYKLLVQYCMDIKKMSFENLLKDTTSEQTINAEMMNWYEMQSTN
jgi:hypothetical protein